jgi:hypothetical protein
MLTKDLRPLLLELRLELQGTIQVCAAHTFRTYRAEDEA